MTSGSLPPQSMNGADLWGKAGVWPEKGCGEAKSGEGATKSTIPTGKFHLCTDLVSSPLVTAPTD